MDARGRTRFGGVRQAAARLRRVSRDESVLRRGFERGCAPVMARRARRRGDGREEEEAQSSPAPLFIEGGVVTGVIKAVNAHASRIACGKITLWPHVCACRQSTGMGHRIARGAGIVCSSTRGI